AVPDPPAVAAPAGNGLAVKGAASGRLRILFIDDERNLLNVYQRAFGRKHDVVVAEGGQEALSLLAKRADFHLVVCDLLMPTVNGMDVYRWAREAHPQLARAFVFVTASVAHQDVRAFLRSVSNKV